MIQLGGTRESHATRGYEEKAISQHESYKAGVSPTAVENAVIVRGNDLRTLDTKPGLPEYVRQIIGRRDYVFADARSKAFQKTRKFRLWRMWMVVEPMLNIAMYAILFGFLLQTSRGIENFLGYLTLGIIFFNFMTSHVTSGAGLVQNQRSMIRAFRFPRAILVLSDSLKSVLDSLVPAVLAVVAAVTFGLPESLSWTILLVIPLFVMLHVFAIGLKFFVARLTAFVPEAKALITVAIRAWFLSSAVFFTLERFAHLPTIYAVMQFNPGFKFLNAIRNVVIYDTIPPVSEWLILLLWTLGAFVVGFIYFWGAEERYVRVA